MKFIFHFVSLVAGVAASESSAFDSKSSASLALLKAQHFKTKREMLAKKQNLHSANALRNFKPSFMQQDVLECDWANEEECYDDNWNVVDCVPYVDGGCPCPEGQEKCGAFQGYTGYCIEPEYCCENDQELCYDVDYNPTGCMSISEGGCPCPEGQEKCGSMPEWNIAGYCTEFCCSDEEETCYDDTYYTAVGCAAYSDGGCPCPEGEEKCGGSDWWPGTCTSLCCQDNEETCYDENYAPTECKSIAEGGCDCPEEEVKCYAYPEYNITGICVDVCCTDEQEMCYDYDTGAETCADIAAGGCPCPEGEEKCGAFDGYPGYCSAPDLCCADDEELCYSDDWYGQPESCALISEGGCACSEGETKCEADPEMNYPGYCTSLCCEEQTCYDFNWEPTSCASWDEDCPTGISFDVLKGKSMTMIVQSTMKNNVAKLQKVKAMKAKMLAHENADYKTIEKIAKAEEVAILRKAKRGVSHKSLSKDVPIFMTKVY